MPNPNYRRYTDYLLTKDPDIGLQATQQHDQYVTILTRLIDGNEDMISGTGIVAQFFLNCITAHHKYFMRTYRGKKMPTREMDLFIASLVTILDACFDYANRNDMLDIGDV